MDLSKEKPPPRTAILICHLDQPSESFLYLIALRFMVYIQAAVLFL